MWATLEPLAPAYTQVMQSGEDATAVTAADRRVRGVMAEFEGMERSEALSEEVDAETLEALAGQLIWRLGRSGDGPVVVRVGLAGSAPLFAELPRLKNATDAELEEAARAGEVRVEWVGQLPG
jgi:hypothetical protein